jgi:hypothetical protein
MLEMAKRIVTIMAVKITQPTPGKYQFSIDPKDLIKIKTNVTGIFTLTNLQNNNPTPPPSNRRKLGINFSKSPELYANLINITPYPWGAGTNNNQALSANQIVNGNPTVDASIYFAASKADTYLVQFTGRAQVFIGYQNVTWSVPGVNLSGNPANTLLIGQGYDPATNKTTARFTFNNPGDAFYIAFLQTTGGVQNIYLMQPKADGSPHPVGQIFSEKALGIAAKVTGIRHMDSAATNINLTTDWSDRTTPNCWSWGNNFTLNQIVGKGPTTIYTQNDTVGLQTEIPWEVLIALANQSHTDLYINIPILASLDYLQKLANLCRYGSDGTNPYTSAQTNPVWAPLNSTSKLYIEYGNELWNSAFCSSFNQDIGWANQLSQRAYYNFLNNIQSDPIYPGGGNQSYLDGQAMSAFIAANHLADNFAQSTFTPDATPLYPKFAPSWFSKVDGGSFGWSIGPVWVALRLKQISDIFKSTFGETAIEASSPTAQIKPILEWQYGDGGGTADRGLKFIQDTFTAHPVRYYFAGGGGGWYVDVLVGGYSQVEFLNNNFNGNTTGWTTSGSTSLVSKSAKPDIPGEVAFITLNGASQSGNTVTLTTVKPHSFAVEDQVLVQYVALEGYSNLDPINTWNKTPRAVGITAVTSNTISYDLAITGLAASGNGQIQGVSAGDYCLQLNQGGQVSQTITFTGGWADITFLAAIAQSDYGAGLTVSLTPVNGGPAINNGQPLVFSEGGNGTTAPQRTDWQFCRTIAFNTGNSNYQYNVTFTNTSAQAVYLTGLGIQTVNAMFAEAGNPQLIAAFNATTGIGTVPADKTLINKYNLGDLVGYEGGWDFNQNITNNSANAYTINMGGSGYSSNVPNVGYYANLDSRNTALCQAIYNQFFTSGGSYPFIYQAIDNPNSWGVSDGNSPKLNVV